ncbi:hypothetical protein JGI22_00045 [Candidatus Kryptobacter tengchongensis]|nr:hypothetical protein JGI22_00045 [Candidatus Kryptobacter tengchongensis]
MRGLFLFLALVLLLSNVALSRELGAGLALGYRSEKPTVGFGGNVYYRYDVPESFLKVKGFAGQLSVGYVTFPKEDQSAEYSFVPVKYGLSYTAYSQDKVELGVLGDVGLAFVSKPKSETKIMGGAGAFVAYGAAPNVKVVGTVKYSAVVKTVHYLGVEVGVLYTLPTK